MSWKGALLGAEKSRTWHAMPLTIASKLAHSPSTGSARNIERRCEGVDRRQHDLAIGLRGPRLPGRRVRRS